MWELDLKKAEHWTINAFELWYWKRLLRFPWTARGYNQFILKEISPECSLEGQMLKLKFQYFGHLMRTDSFEKPWCWERLKAGGEGDDRGWNSWMALLTECTWVWVNCGSWWWTERPGMLQSMGLQSRTRLSNWTALIVVHLSIAHIIHCYIIRVIQYFCTVNLAITYHTTNWFLYKRIIVRLISLLDLLAYKHFCLTLWIFMKLYFDYFMSLSFQNFLRDIMTPWRLLYAKETPIMDSFHLLLLEYI